jgi:hypothetical protein
VRRYHNAIHNRNSLLYKIHKDFLLKDQTWEHYNEIKRAVKEAQKVAHEIKESDVAICNKNIEYYKKIEMLIKNK